jgi:regulator of protease activity HflC (stomatin/prohibitin superfamily)
MKFGMDLILTILTLGIVRFVFVNEGTNQVVTRFGKYRNTLGPGLQMFWSAWGLLGMIHKFRITDPDTGKLIYNTALDIREVGQDYAKEKVLSADNVQFEVDAVVFFQVIDAYKALFKVANYTEALRKLVQSILRAEIGEHDLEQTYSNRTAISEDLTAEADKATKAWGIRVIRIEIKSFELGEFADQLLRQKQQDIEKRQQILQAEGLREAKIKEAQGDSEATRMRADANALAKRLYFQAEAYGYDLVADVLLRKPGILEYLKYHTAESITANLANGQATKLFLPNSMAQLLAAFTTLSATVKETETNSEPENGHTIK